ncbi:MAG: TIGR02281 family clan AA aspartic protease [Gammaproteobacteria bacterium]|nr:TIGR02281 family clan AA aspartic protease [Gammaproteobacteria bacterium]
MKNALALLVLLLLSAPSVADDTLRLVGLFDDKAAVIINGQQTIINTHNLKRGLRLISSTQDSAEIEINGTIQPFQLGSSSIVASYQKPQRLTVQINQNAQGMYQASGKVNGQITEFLVDTGASVVAMNEYDAEHFGLSTTGIKVKAQTAGGTVQGYQTILKTISIGQIQLNNIKAVVLPGAHPNRPLLGMSFLQHLKVNQQQRRLLLESMF